MQRHARAAGNEHIRRNIAYVILNWPDAGMKGTGIAALLNVVPSTIHRWLRGKVTPSHAKVTIIAKHCGIEASLFYEPHDMFVVASDSKSTFMKRDYKKTQQRIVLRSILKWQHLWNECAERHQGSYFLYNRLGKLPTNDNDKELIAVSLLTIGSKTDRGIEFELHNLDDRNKAETKVSIHYIYKGLVFPIYDALCFYGEEQSADEPLTIVTSSSQKNPPSLLSGYLVAIGVSPAFRVASGAKILLTYKGRKHLDVGDVQKELGIFSASRIPESIRRHL